MLNIVHAECVGGGGHGAKYVAKKVSVSSLTFPYLAINTHVHAYNMRICQFGRPIGLLIKPNDGVHLGNDIDNKRLVWYLQHWQYWRQWNGRLRALRILVVTKTRREREEKINYVRVYLQRRRWRRTTSSFRWSGSCLLFILAFGIRLIHLQLLLIQI